MVKQDRVTKNGRQIVISWSTENNIIDPALGAPRIFQKTFPLGTTTEQVTEAFKAHAVPLVQNAVTTTNNSIHGNMFEVDV